MEDEKITYIPAQPGQFVIAMSCEADDDATRPTADHLLRWTYPVYAWRVVQITSGTGRSAKTSDYLEPMSFEGLEQRNTLIWYPMPDGRFAIPEDIVVDSIEGAKAITVTRVQAAWDKHHGIKAVP